MMVSTKTQLAIEHLLLRMRPLNRALRIAVELQGRRAARLSRPDVTALCITDEQVLTLLGDADALLNNESQTMPEGVTRLLPEETRREMELREQSDAAGMSLPLDALAEKLGLSSEEIEAVLLCAAPEIDRSYERIYAYILDDLNRRYPCVELLSTLTAASLEERLMRRRALTRFNRLRRAGLLRAYGEAATELRQELRLGAGLLDFLTGVAADPTTCFYDPAEITLPARIELPPEVQVEAVARLGVEMREGRVSVLGVWGARSCGKDEVVMAVASAAGLPLRRLLASELTPASRDAEQSLLDGVHTASVLGAMLWVETDELSTPEHERLRERLAEAVARAHIPVCLTGVHPWRPMRLLESCSFAEIELTTPGYQTRRKMWLQALPDIQAVQLNSLASRFRLSSSEIRAVVQVARTRAQLNSNSHPAPVNDELDSACLTVTRRRSNHFATIVKPKRGPDDLILPHDIHKQVLEIASFFRAGALVDEEWGFNRMTSGGGGIKALFTGEPGTGKTLAAEVIAGVLNQSLLKVDLARIVSKWVGETEKNLETVFSEAEESHALLFFDEADSLFGKRGEVRHGTDRYANLEVGYLLQRLEDYYGLVILASNLKDQIDAAFTRRFHVIIHFPRPQPEERRLIWQIAFPSTSPLSPEVDFEFLEELEMTGAAITGSARTAAMLAANEQSASINMSHIIQAVARQYQREARILSPTELGQYTSFLPGAQ
jgi:hypothetical protein